jgi:transposase-like protein
MPDPEVRERPVRRRFTAEYKRRIVEEANAAAESGAVGALLRREGLYSSHLVEWRQPRTPETTPRATADAVRA